jgi:formate dehydrogenase major subunit
VGTSAARIVAIRPITADVNKGHLCVKGRYGFEFNHAEDRITWPMLRRGNHWEKVTWEDALAEAASRLRAIIKRDGPNGGPQAIGMLGSARATNEENYYAQKFARVVLGTNNVDACARVCHQPSAAALQRLFGTGAATNCFDDIERAATIVVAGCNPTENHPIVGSRIRQAARRGAKLIVIDPRRIDLAAIADVHLAVRPGTNLPLFQGLAAAIFEQELEDREFLSARVDGLDEFRRSLAGYSPEQAAAACGVSATVIRQAATLYATNKPAMCFHGLGITEHFQGTDGVTALIHLALLTGNIGRPGAGVNPLRGQNNVQGSAHMGCEPQTLTGGQNWLEARDRFEQAWAVTLPTTPGLNLLQMIDAAKQRRLSALWVFGYDVYFTLPNESATAKALSNLELVIVQDLFMNKTAERFGHIFFPAASVFEKDGTFMNSDRRVQRIRAALEPAGESRPDRWIIAQMAHRLGFGEHFAHASSQEIWDEIRSVWPAGAGLSYPRLQVHPPHWPCPSDDHPGTPVLHQTSFAKQQRAQLRPIALHDSPEQPDGEYPFRLTTGRRLYQFNAGTMTMRAPNATLQPHDELEMSPFDGKSLDICTGDWVAIQSHFGSCELQVCLTERVKPGELFVTFSDPDRFVNRVTSSVRDRVTDTPEYKLTAVKVVKSPNRAPES